MKINIGTSVFKREAEPKSRVVDVMKANGWRDKGSLAGITYLENSGINLSVVQGPGGGTLVFPSGVVRGMVFSDKVGVGDDSTVGIEDTPSKETKAEAGGVNSNDML
jgi:hypothetical protein